MVFMKKGMALKQSPRQSILLLAGGKAQTIWAGYKFALTEEVIQDQLTSPQGLQCRGGLVIRGSNLVADALALACKASQGHPGKYHRGLNASCHIWSSEGDCESYPSTEFIPKMVICVNIADIRSG